MAGKRARMEVVLREILVVLENRTAASFALSPRPEWPTRRTVTPKQTQHASRFNAQINNDRALCCPTRA
jgi:hypothetical protein